MANIIEMKEYAGELRDEIKDILEVEDAEKIDFDEVEKKTKELEKLERNIEIFEKAEAKKAKEVERAAAGAPVQGAFSEGDKKDFNRFRFTSAFRQINTDGKLSGIEAELNEEAKREAKEAKVDLTGNIAIPSAFIKYAGKNVEKRALTVATEGGDIVPVDFGEVIPFLEPKPVVLAAGATMKTGLTGDYQRPRSTNRTVLTWEGETDANVETTPTYDNVKWTPKRLSGYVDISKQSMIQSSFSVEMDVRNQLNREFALAIDKASIQGVTGGDNPVGILFTSGIGDVALGANGAALDWASIIDLITQVHADDAGEGSLGFLTTHQVKGNLMTIPKQASGVEGNFLQGAYDYRMNELAGLPLFASNQVPGDLDKGTSTGVCHALIYGNYEDWCITQWGGVDILMDPYTQAGAGKMRIQVNAFLDAKAYHPASFAAIQDILIQ